MTKSVPSPRPVGQRESEARMPKTGRQVLAPAYPLARPSRTDAPPPASVRLARAWRRRRPSSPHRRRSPYLISISISYLLSSIISYHLSSLISDKIVGFHDATRLTTLRNSAMPGSLTPRDTKARCAAMMNTLILSIL
jgi:hypothetical protein